MTLANPSQTTSYDQSNVYKLDVSDVLAAILLDDASFLGMIGMSGEVASQTKHQWIEDALNATTITQTAGNSFLSGTSSTVLTFTANISRITAGTLLKDRLSGKSEVLQVTAVSGVSATVTRGYGGSTKAAHASGATYDIIANARPQGMAGPKDESTARTRPYNFTQIFSKGVKLTGTAIAIEHDGVSSEDSYQIDLRLRELTRELDRTLIMGMRASADVVDGTYGTMGGVIFWTSVANTANKTTTGEALTPTVLNAMIKQCWDAGLEPNAILVGGVQKQKISAFDQEFRRSTMDSRRAGFQIDRFVSDLGPELEVIVDRWCPNDVAVVFSKDQIKVMPLKNRAFFLEKLGKTGDSDDWQIVGEYTMEFRNANAAAYHDNLTQ